MSKPDEHTAPPRRAARWRRRLRDALPWVAGAYLAAAFLATHLPLPTGAGGLPHLDKLAHLTIFAGLATLAAAWRITRFDPARRAAAVAFGLCLTYAAIDEATQFFTATRTPDPADFAADAVGSLVGLAVFFPLLRWWRRHG